mgnify:CR=1 FL=1|tara:strand:- start:1752 stop:1958 length:207 start_codon:yes stop_codon:yes gene_type:complete
MIGDLIKHEFFTHDQKTKTETGVIIVLFKNATNKEFAEILWSDGSITSSDLESIEKLSIEKIDAQDNI